MNSSRPLLYNPDQKGKEQLIDEFVIRQKEFMMIVDGLLRSSIQTSPQHYLVVGQRGMGKTTLLLRVKYAIEDNPDLNKWLVPIKFSEEQYQIATLDRLWEEIAEYLETADSTFEGLFAEMEKHEDKKDYERIALDILVKAIKKQKKRLVVMIDNLGDLFRKLGDKGNHRLREVLLTHTNIQLIGASADMLEHTFNYDKPFFEFFQQITLQPINKENSFKLLENLGTQYGQGEAVGKLILENPAKIEVLRRLTGGVPRTIALLFSIFIDHQKGSTFEDLLLLLDQVNSFYKHRMDDLKPQQQRIIDALAKAWDPISTKEILKRSKLGREGIESNQISAQLNVLVDNQVVEAVNGRGKLKSYRVRERFFNIWYLMRYGKRQHKEEVLWLVRFLETWCTRAELAVQTEEQIKALQKGGYSPQAAYFKTMALYHTKGIDNDKKLQLLEQTESYLQLSHDQANVGIISRFKKQELDNIIVDVLKKGEAFKKIKKEDLPSLNKNSTLYLIISIARRLVDDGKGMFLIDMADLFQIGIDLGDPRSMNGMGMIFHYSDPDAAIKYYNLAIAHGSLEAARNLGLVYQYQIKDSFLAEKYYLLAVEKGNIDAIRTLASLYEKQIQNMDLAEKYYKLAANKGDVKALNNLGIFYKNQKQNNELAEKYYKMAADKNNLPAMYNIARFYRDEKNDISLAEKYYVKAVENNHPRAGNELALLYINKGGESELIEKYFLQSSELGNTEASENLMRFYFFENNTPQMISFSEKLFGRPEVLQKANIVFEIIEMLAIKKQYNFLLQQFQKPDSQLMKYARPMYYVLAWFMRDELPGEYEKVSPEIKETVDEIIQKVILAQIEGAKIHTTN